MPNAVSQLAFEATVIINDILLEAYIYAAVILICGFSCVAAYLYLMSLWGQMGPN